jgi:hypothetical protein
MCGTDWRSYEQVYNNDMIYYDRETGYGWYMQLFHLFNISFWHFFIITKIITLLIFIYIIEKYSSRNIIFFIWFFFLSIAGFYLWIDNPMRNLIAIVIFYLSIPSLIERKLVKYILLNTLACTFHSTMVVVFFLYWFANVKFKYYQIIIIYIIFIILFLDISNIFHIGVFFNFIPDLSDKIIYYSLFEKPVSLLSMGFMSYNIIFFLILWQKDKFYNLKGGVMLFNFSFLFLILYRIFLTFPVANRFAFMISPFYVISAFMMLNIYKKYCRLLLVTGILGCTLISTYNKITADYRYIPYSNYMFYILQDKPPYTYREGYNKKYSPYKNKDIN